MTSQIVQKLWNYCNVLRDDGMSYGDYVEQLTYLLFLKMADERTKPPYSQPSQIPDKYSWHSLLKQDGETDPLKREDLDDFVSCYHSNLDRSDKRVGGNRHTRKATWSDKKPDGRWRAYDYDELIARDKASLDIFWLKDDSLEDSANLPNPDIIAQEIVDDLEAALEQFRLISNDLGGTLQRK